MLIFDGKSLFLATTKSGNLHVSIFGSDENDMKELIKKCNGKFRNFIAENGIQLRDSFHDDFKIFQLSAIDNQEGIDFQKILDGISLTILNNFMK